MFDTPREESFRSCHRSDYSMKGNNILEVPNNPAQKPDICGATAGMIRGASHGDDSREAIDSERGSFKSESLIGKAAVVP